MEMTEKELKKTRIISKIKGIAIVVLCVLLFVSLIGNFVLYKHSQESDEQSISGKIIGESVSALSQLTTTEYDYTIIDEYSDNRELDFLFVDTNVPFTEKSLIISFDGIIKYGVDLSEIGTPVIDDENKTITIEMPKIIMISHEIDEDSIQYLDEKDGLFNRVKPSDSDQLQKENKLKAEKQAIERGIIKKVQENTEKVLGTFIPAMYPVYSDYKVNCDFPDQKKIKRGTISEG